MILGAISPKNEEDKRTTLHPESIKPLLDIGIEVIFERGLGSGIDISDEDMAQLGANPASREECLRKSDLLFSSTSLPNEEISLLKKRSIFLGLLDPFSNKEQFHHFLQNSEYYDLALCLPILPIILAKIIFQIDY